MYIYVLAIWSLYGILTHSLSIFIYIPLSIILTLSIFDAYNMIHFLTSSIFAILSLLSNSYIDLYTMYTVHYKDNYISESNEKNPMEYPEFLEPIPNITVAVGREAKIPCLVRNLGPYKVCTILRKKMHFS